MCYPEAFVVAQLPVVALLEGQRSTLTEQLYNFNELKVLYHM